MTATLPNEPMTGTTRVLIIEDDPAIAEAVQRVVARQNGTGVVAGDGRVGLRDFFEERPDLVVLDIGLPTIDGLDVCRRIRAAGDDTPVLMLTARDAIDDRVQGLDAGADDYLVKPFALAELLARLRALLRRRGDDTSEALTFADLTLDPVTREARRGERPFSLTRIEFDLLELFLRHPRQVLTRELILDRVWGYTFDSGTNSLAVYVGYLRRKTEEGGEPRLIHTARGVGYVLREG